MIKSSKESTQQSYIEIKQGQTGGYKPLKTRFSHFNDICHGGISRQKIYTLGGLSGFGKSHTLRQIETDIFDEKLNPGAKEDVLLVKVDWEMSKSEAILSRVQIKTGKPFSELMYGEPDEISKKAFNEVYLELTSDYIFEAFDTFKPDNFFREVKEFCDKHQDKKQIVLTIDNVNLIDTEGSDETTALGHLMTQLIRLKREIANISIIQLAQLNRSLKERINPKEHFPRTTDFFNSSKIEHASDVQIVIHNPYLLGYMSYGAVNYERYSYLSEYLEEKNKHAEFKTKGLAYWHYVKVRSKNSMKEFKDLFVEKIYEVDKDDTELKLTTKTTLSIPVFGEKVMAAEKDIPPPLNYDLSEAFENNPSKNDDVPF